MIQVTQTTNFSDKFQGNGSTIPIDLSPTALTEAVQTELNANPVVFSNDFLGTGNLASPISIVPVYFSNQFGGVGTQANPISLINSTDSPNGVLNYVEKTSSYTVQSTDCTINCISGSFTVTLPSTGIIGKVFIIKNSGTATTITVTSTVTIDAVFTKTITNKTALRLQFTGSKYIII